MSNGNGGATAAGALWPTVGPGIYGAAKGKDGRKGAVAGRMAGRSFLEAAGGSVPGYAVQLAGMRTGNRPLMVAGGLGSLAGMFAGSAHGSRAAFKNAKRRGDIKKSGSLSLAELGEISKSFGV